MAVVWFSHLGETPIKGVKKEEILGCSIGEIIANLEKKHPGFKNIILKEGDKSTFDISTRVTFRPKVTRDSIDTEALFFGPETQSIESPDDTRVIENEDHLLFSILKPERFKAFLEEGLMDQGKKFEAPEGSTPRNKTLKTFLNRENLSFKAEKIMGFIQGEAPLATLIQEPGQPPAFVYNPQGKTAFEAFQREKCRLVPRRLADAIKGIWNKFDENSRLRLFQEDTLFFILSKLSENAKDLPYTQLLISAPTGGGKTEAFLFPLLARILFEKEGFLVDAWPGESPAEKIRCIIMYPTKALANDQTKRLVEMLYHINRDKPDNQLLTLGVLTGDTPRTENQLKKEPVIQICPACGHANLVFEQDDNEIFYFKCQTSDCPSPLHKYCRLTSKDIVAHPPDILITNPDTVSVSLQNPVRRRIFDEAIEAVVFDEIHLYEGIFGCNVSHLLRRLEEAIGRIPLYVGLSATIENAGALASLMFNEDPEKILYLRHTPDRPYQYDDGTNRVRYHALARPAPYQGIIRATLNTAMAVAHAFSDPANRKSLVFANKTADVDRLVTYMDEAENKYFRQMTQSIFEKVKSGEALNESELDALAEVWQWLTFLEDNGSPFYGAVFPGWHRGALEKKQRLEAINRFMSLKPIQTGSEEEFPIDVMFATKTLELGIDIGTVSSVLNCSAPFSNNEYFQRVGRGGRRGNSLALTILNDVGAIDAWFAYKFDDIIENPEFEGIPLIVTNKIITRQHVVGRILDYLAQELSNTSAFEIQVKDLRGLKVVNPDSGNDVGLSDDPEAFARGLFHQLFKQPKVMEGEGKLSGMDRLGAWFVRESEVLGINPSNIDETQIREWLIEKCKDLVEHEDPSKETYWESNKSLSNYFNTVDRDLLTPLRGDGQSVSIFTKGKSEDKFVEDFTRLRATRSMPPGAYARQGMNSFVVEAPVKNEDEKSEEALVDLLWDEDALLDYYQDIFGKGFPKNHKELRHISGRVVIPSELMVRHSPYRFYCDNPKCHRTYTHHELDENLLCVGCGRRLKQVTQLFLCTHCGQLIEPPVPKVCINPGCIKRKMDNDPDFLRKIRSHNTYKNQSKPLFRFISLAKQNWKCRDCGVVFNFFDYHQGMWNDTRLKSLKELVLSGQYFNRMDLNTPLGIAAKFLFFPEHFGRGKDYVEMGYRPAMFKHYKRFGGCDQKVRFINIPTVTSIQNRYYKKERDLDHSLSTQAGELEIFELQVVDLAKEYTRAFDKGQSIHHREKVYLYHDIFENKYLANLFETHAFSLNFGNRIEEFLGSSQMPSICLKQDCGPECPHLALLDEEVRGIYAPKLYIEEWQLSEGNPRKPDPRAMWCRKAGEEDCRPECQGCEFYMTEKETLRLKQLKYIVLHTLKHGIMWALPKYVGINLQGLNGQLYPNQNNCRDDPFKGDILVMDSAESGSGAMLMVKNNWEKIWNFARDVLNLTLNGQGNLNLPYACFRFNNDLCPHISLQFMKWLNEE